MQCVFHTDPAAIDRELRNAWMPYFCRTDRRAACVDTFMAEVGRLFPRLPEIELSLLPLPSPSKKMVRCCMMQWQVKYASTGSLDGWHWRESKTLPVTGFDGLAGILRLVEESGVWPDGLLDAYMVMIPQAEGNATPLEQRL